MANLSFDFTGEPYQEAEVNCFAIPGPGVCLSVKTDTGKVDLDLSREVFDRLAKSIKGYQEG
jgi:hypothetical protein